MKSTIEKLSSLERKLNIEVPADEVQAAFDRAYKSIQRHAQIKGFRKGKAPIATVRSVFGDRVKQDVAQDLIETSYSAAIAEHSLDPITYPTIEFDPIDDQRGFAFTAEFEVRPEVKSIQFEGLQAKKEKLSLDAKKVDEILEGIRRSRAQAMPLLEDRPAQKGDVAVVDFEGSLLTGPLEGGSGQGHELELGGKSFIPGFEDGVEGMRVGQEKTLNLSFPEGYHAAELSGKPVTFKVKLVALKKRELPELNDEFAKQMGPYESAQALRDAIAKDVQERDARRIDEDFRNAILKALVDRNPIDVPKSLAADQKKALVDDLKQRMQQQGLAESAFQQYRAQWDQDFEQTANYMIRANFLIDALSKEQGLRADSADFDAKMAEYSKDTGIEPSKINEFYSEPSRKSRLMYQLTEKKVIDFLISKADVKEVEPGQA